MGTKFVSKSRYNFAGLNIGYLENLQTECKMILRYTIIGLIWQEMEKSVINRIISNFKTDNITERDCVIFTSVEATASGCSARNRKLHGV